MTRPGGDPEGWRKAYFEASAARERRSPGDILGRFFLGFLPTLSAGQILLFILEKTL